MTESPGPALAQATPERTIANALHVVHDPEHRG